MGREMIKISYNFVFDLQMGISVQEMNISALVRGSQLHTFLIFVKIQNQ